MRGHVRFAVYYAPPAGSDLARFGAAWLGWDAEAEAEVAHPPAGGLDVASMTAAPRKYGFHGTLKPPFRLAEGTDPDQLDASVRSLADTWTTFDAPPLALRRIGRFVALVPSAPDRHLSDLAAACVRDLDDFRAPPDKRELERRRRTGLSGAEETNLLRWGYPYVMDSFRFHLTLTGALDPMVAEDTIRVLTPQTRPFCQGPLPVREICLFGERPTGRFHLIRRYPLRGAR